MRTKIQNIDDLRSEIKRLELRREGYEDNFQEFSERIKQKLLFPVMIYNKIGNFFSSLLGVDSANPVKKEHSDWVTNILRVGLPVFLNKFFFPRSGFLLKSAIAMVSQKAATNVNKDTVTDLIGKLSNWIKGSKPKTRKNPVLPYYGIPPDSETF